MNPTHRNRWITGLVALPLIYFVVDAGGVLFAALIAAAAGLTLWEFYRVVFQATEPGIAKMVPLVGICLAPLMIGMVFRFGAAHALAVVGIDLILAAGLSLPLYKQDDQAPFLVGKQVLGLVYIPGLLSFLVLIRSGDSGAQWIFWILCIVAAGDIGAFYTGTYLGRRKLCPWVSPKKTIEGSLGGLICNVAAALLFKAALLPHLGATPAAVFALIIGLAGQVGDLFASTFKRTGGVKDSGRLLPGHGGLLDRLDALLLVSPLAYLLKVSIF